MQELDVLVASLLHLTMVNKFGLSEIIQQEKELAEEQAKLM